MGSPPPAQRYCRCGARLAADNPGRQCASCQRASRNKLIAPPEVPAEFWQTEQLRDACVQQHMGRVARAYRMHPYHQPVYGRDGISQRLLGQWMGLSQVQISRIETGSPIRNLDTLAYWARTLRIPVELLWFDLPGETRQLLTTKPAASHPVAPPSPRVLEPPDAPTRTVLPDELGKAEDIKERRSSKEQRLTDVEPCADTNDEQVDDPEHDPVLIAPWDHRGTVGAAVVLSGGDGRVRRRAFLSLTGSALTAPAHQWLIRDPEPLVSGLAGGRISATLVDQLPAMITMLRTMDDAAGGGTVLSLARQAFGWVARLLDQASYDEHTGRRLHVALAELGQLTGWVAHDAGDPGLGQRYHVAALRAAHAADDRPLGAHILGGMADQAARHGRPAEAVTLIETAVFGIRGRETPRLLAELYIRKAYALATLQDGSACSAAVSKARTQAEQFKSDSDPLWMYWVSPAEITAGAGDCLLQLGQPSRATALLDGGIAMFDESFARDRQVYLTHLSDALARPGKQRDLDAAANRGLAAVHLAESVTSTRGMDCLRDLYVQLQPHAPVPAVRDFLERARVVLAA